MTSLAGRTVGVIGLGLMGRPIAVNLQTAGAALVVHNRSRDAVDALARMGMQPADSPAAVARAAGTIVLALPDTATVEEVVAGRNGLLSAGLDRRLVIDMGTTAVSATRRLAARVAEAGGTFVDAPVSGGTAGAEQGTLSIMAGGGADAIARARPVLDVLGARTTHVGDVGAGQVAKAANQVIVGLSIGAVAEALALARRAGADPAKVRDALRGGFAESRILELHGKRMVEGDFAPGGKSTIQRKDLDQAMTLAAEAGLDLPATALCRELYDRLIEAGHGGLDHAALIKAIDPDWPDSA